MDRNRKPHETKTRGPTNGAPAQYPQWIDPRDYWPSGYPWRPGFPRFLEAGLHWPPCIV